MSFFLPDVINASLFICVSLTSKNKDTIAALLHYQIIRLQNVHVNMYIQMTRYSVSKLSSLLKQ